MVVDQQWLKIAEVTAECREENFKFPTKKVKHSLSLSTCRFAATQFTPFCNHPQLGRSSARFEGLRRVKAAFWRYPTILRNDLMIALCNFLCCPEVDFHLCIKGTTNLDSWYGGPECNRVKFLNGGIAIALEFLEGQFNIHPGVETFTAISKMFYFLYKSLVTTS